MLCDVVDVVLVRIREQALHDVVHALETFASHDYEK